VRFPKLRGTLECSFCHKTDDQVEKLICAKDGRSYICEACVAICNSILNDETPKPAYYTELAPRKRRRWYWPFQTRASSFAR